MINFHLLYKTAQAERMLKEAGPVPGLAQRAVGSVKNPAVVQEPRESTLDFLARHNVGPTVTGPAPGWVPPSMRQILSQPVPRSPQGGPALRGVNIPPDFLERYRVGPTVIDPPPGQIPPYVRRILSSPVPRSPQGGPMAPTRIEPVPQYRTPISR